MRRLAAAALVALGLAGPAAAEIEIQRVTSPGGITAWLYEEHSLPMLNIEASFQGGAALDPPGKAGAARMMAALLTEGAGERDATAFAEATEALAAGIGIRAGSDSVAVSARMLTENRDAALELLRSALLEPRFDPEAVERVRQQLLSAARDAESDPNAIAGRAFYGDAFPGHPYAAPTDGTVESIAGLDLADLGAAREATLARDRLRLAVVGDISAGELGPLLDQVFGGLPAAGPPLPPVAEPHTPGTTRVIDFDIPQSVVLFGQPGIARSDPDFIPAYVMDHMLGGGGFGSRLMQEVRDKRGLTYGISTWLASGDFGWLYMGGFSTANARAGEAIDLVRAEWRRMAEQGVSPEELEAAKRYLTGAYPLRFDGNGQIAGELLGLQVAGLGPEYVNERNALVEAVTVEDVARVARRILRPEALTFVIVGRPEGLAAAN
ncbi:pitrilysin family protein [Amaricoccus sp.]|uniref:M16 family metallopeptidase n=1 Tax=Amaricoccus sp. TaxID=1872485 RepID=UPI002628A9B4|nr:pitrilysin family protein [Amaricoccus sp.]HRO12598.1 pitrilysin family protein [Amaricoccus sp.]